MLELMIGAVVGGVVETLSGLAVHQTEAVARRIQQSAGLVEKQPPTAMSAAIRRAVTAAAAELRQDYVDQLYEGDADAAVTDMIALLDHPPFAEEVTAKLLYRGQPDFERLCRAYLDLPPAQRSQRWDALEPALKSFFAAIEKHLDVDPEVGELVQGIRKLTHLTVIADKTDLIAEISAQIQGYQARIAAAGESAAGGIEQLVRLMDRQHATLPAVRAYLNSLRQECNRLPLAGDIRNAANRGPRPELVNVYVDLQVAAQPTLEQVLDRLAVPEADRNTVLTRLKAWMRKGHTDLDAAMRGIERSTILGADLLLARQQDDDLKKHPLMPYAKDEDSLRRAVDKLTALEALSAHPHLVLLGDPGSGKSTFVNHLAVVFAEQILSGVTQSDLISGLNAPLLPLRVVLRRWSARLRPGDEAGRELAYAALVQQTSLDRETLLAQLDQPDTLVLFDGLDESPARRPGSEDGLDRRGLLVASVADFCAAHPRCRVLVTCRVKPYQSAGYQIDNLPVVTLAELDKPRIERFVHLWYDEAARLEPEKRDKAAVDRRRLLTSLDRRPDLTRMAGTPLLLTMLATVNAWAGLPESRAELYDRCVEQLLWEWEKRKRDATRPEDAPAAADSATEVTSLLDLLHEAGLRRVDVERLLWEQTYLAHEQSSANGDSNREARADLPVDGVRKALALMHGKGGQGWDWADRVVDLMAERGGLLVESETGTFTFPHRTFQEYLAARWLLERDDRAILAAHLAASDTWREVVLLACGYLNYQGRYGDVQALIAEISGGRFADETAWRRLLTAGTAWLEFGPDRAVGNTGDDLKVQLPAKLTALMQDRHAPPRQRLDAGLILADLHILPPDLDDFVLIRAADSLGYDFRIGKYPVTNAQFRRFFDDGGYAEDKPWWPKDALDDLERSSNQGWRNGPRYWGDPEYDRDTQPVVGVSWYEAMAYCAWLTARLRKVGKIGRNEEVRLPTEKEWERAARSTHGGEYPWGGDFDPALTNSEESDLGQATPVHMYPHGATPEDVYDLAGNVWEWSNDRDSGDYSRLMGGAWYSDANGIGASSRLRHHDRSDRYFNYGFRCVVGPHLLWEAYWF